jgi:hypothetical protein
MGFDDGSVDPGSESEIVRIYDQTPHAASLAGPKKQKSSSAPSCMHRKCKRMDVGTAALGCPSGTARQLLQCQRHSEQSLCLTDFSCLAYTRNGAVHADAPPQNSGRCDSPVARTYEGRLAQLVRAPALQAGGRRFESCTAHHLAFRTAAGDVVQLVRTLPCHGRGRGFESRRPRHSFQALAKREWPSLAVLCLSLCRNLRF